jgi:hypothetical protein
MSGEIRPQPWYWVVAVLALLWNLFGCWAYWLQVTMTEAQLAALPPAQRALYTSLPTWVTAAFAIAVFGGALASLMLLLRRRAAEPLFLLSLAGVVAQQVHMYFLSDTLRVIGGRGMVMPALVLAMAIFLVWFVRRAIANRWLG